MENPQIREPDGRGALRGTASRASGAQQEYATALRHDRANGGAAGITPWRTSMTTLQINGKSMNVDAPADTPMLWVLRDHLGLTGTKFGCGMALCGACTVHLDGEPVRACQTPLSVAAGKKITTIEGVGATRVGKAVQNAWLAIGVPQCGYCQAGQIMSAAALLQKTPKPSDTEIEGAMSGNLCRCGTYTRIRSAIKVAAGMKGEA
jgi:isoquinoline 1-oxidoreductase alpha subunit